MRTTLGGLALLLAVAAVAPPGAADEARERNTLVDQILAASGARQQIQALAAGAQKRLAESPAGRDAEAQAAAGRFLAQAFRAEALLAVVRDRFRDGFDAERAAAALQWFRSPVGRKIARLEAQAASPDAEPALGEFAAGLGSRPPSSSRFVLVNRMLEATDQTDFTVESMRAFLGGMARGLDRAQAGPGYSNVAEFERAWSAAAPRNWAAIDQAVFTLLLFAYRGATDTELDQYLQFLRSEAGRWVTRTFQQGFLQAVGTTAEQATVSMARAPRPAVKP